MTTKVFPDAPSALAGVVNDDMTVMAGGIGCAVFPRI
jgi:hypothetical protein